MKQVAAFELSKNWKYFIQGMGYDPQNVLEQAGLPVDLFTREMATLTPADYFDLLHGVEAAAGEEDIALSFAKVLSAEAFDPPIFACMCSPNINSAFSRYAEYKCLVAPMVIDVEISDRGTYVSATCYGYDRPPPRFVASLEIVIFLVMARLGTGKNVIPVSVEITDLPQNLASFEEFTGCKATLSTKTRICFSVADAELPFKTEHRAMWDFFEPGLRQRLSQLKDNATIADKVKSLLLEMLPTGRSGIEQVAERLALSKRTLQRKLAETEDNYKDVLQKTREELAEFYLTKTEYSSGEISFLLGFHDTNSFYRAFNAWHGITPERFRAGIK